MKMRDPYELWLNQVSESKVTHDKHLDAIKTFENWIRENYGLDAKEIPSSWREAKYESVPARERYLDQLKDVLKDYFGYVKGEYTPLSVNRLMSVVTSYLHAFDIPVKSTSLRHAYVTYHNRDVTKQEIRRILDHSDVRNAAAYLVLYESGMRPDTLVKLRYLHLKEEFLAHRIPMKIDLTSDILKCRVTERWTFIGKDGFKALKRYLVTRLPLREDDYVFARKKPKGGHISPGAISQAFSETVKKLGIAKPRGADGRKPKAIHLYCLKTAFRKFMLVEEAYKEFWMGRSNTQTHYVSKDVEYHRRLYSEGYENLCLCKPRVDAETITKLTRENLTLKAKVERMENRLRILEEAERERRHFLGLDKPLTPEQRAALEESIETIKRHRTSESKKS